MIRRVHSGLTIVLVTFALSACGGGGGSGGAGGGNATYSLSGFVTSAFDDAGIQGVAISLSGARTASTTTDISGRYSFSGLANGSYTVTPTLADAIFIPDNIQVMIAGANVSDGDLLALRRSNLGSGIEFLPQFFLSNEQLRVSLHVADGELIYTDSSGSPLKKQALDGSPAVALADRFESAENVVLHGGNTYWIAGGDLHRMSSGGVTTLLVDGLRSAEADVTSDIVVDNANAYWVDQAPTQNCSPPCNWVVQKVPLNGGAIVDLATADRRIASLAIDADSLFWEEESLEPLDPGCNCGSKILSVPKAGGSPVLLVDGSLNGNLPPVPPGFTPASWLPTGGIALSAGEIVFAVSGNSAYDLKSIPKVGGAIANLATVATPVAFATGTVIDITVAGGNILWLDIGNAELKSLPLAGGAVTSLAGGMVNPGGLAMNTTSAYWTESGAYSGCCLVMGAGSVRRIPLSGGSAATAVATLDNPGAIAADDTNIAWSEAWRIGRAPISGGVAVTAVSGITENMARIAISQSKVYILDGEYIKAVPLMGGNVEKVVGSAGTAITDFSVQGGDITADIDRIYWTTKDVAGAPVVRQLTLAGGGPVVIANEANFVNPQDCYWRIAVVDQAVYWSEGSMIHPVGCAIRKVPVDGGTVSTLVDQPFMVDFTVDDINVYFSEFENIGSIRRLSVNGGASLEVASDVYAWVMANDAENLYWLDLQGGSPGGMEKTAGPTDWVTIPIDVLMDPFLAFEAVLIDQTGFYISETQTGSIHRIY
jgi:hypothetical protein